MSSLLITKEARSSLAVVVLSCKVFGKKDHPGVRHLVGLSRREGSFHLDDIIVEAEKISRDFALLYKQLKVDAGLSKVDFIDPTFILKHFGNQHHIEYALDLIRANSIVKNHGQEFADKFLFSHVVVKGKITGNSCNRALEAIYAGDSNVKLINLVAHPAAGKIIKGGNVLIHQATIIKAGPKKNLVDWLKIEQTKSREFTDAVRRIKSVDYGSFWGLKDWTEKMIRQYRF